MENQDTSQSLFDLRFDENLKQSLRGAATWGGITAIFSISGSILSIINYFVQRNKLKSYDLGGGFGEMRVQSQTSGNFISVIVGLIIAIFLFYFLNRFSRSTKTGLDTNDSGSVRDGLANLSTYFKVLGVLIIIGIVFFSLALLVGISSNI
jgi:hypothetical protein